MSLSLVPYSVRMRRGGYVLSGRRWIPERSPEKERAKAEMLAMEERVRLAAPYRINWMTYLPVPITYDDSRFLAMTDEEWRRFQSEDIETWKSAESRRVGLQRWDRVYRRRAVLAASYLKGVESDEPSPASLLIGIRADYLANPAEYFYSDAELEIAVEDLEDRIRALPSGRWRLTAVLMMEKEQQQRWQAAYRVQAVFRGWRVRRRLEKAAAAEAEKAEGEEKATGWKEKATGWKETLEKCEGM